MDRKDFPLTVFDLFFEGGDLKTSMTGERGGNLVVDGRDAGFEFRGGNGIGEGSLFCKQCKY